MNQFESLNERQKEAVLHTQGPLLIVAGAGAGKTKTITERIVHLIQSGVEPQNILAVTFTNKAAKEMAHRIEGRLREEKLLADDSFSFNRPMIKTFHSLGLYIIRENAEAFGVTKQVVVLDEDDALSIIKTALLELSIDLKQFEPRKIKHLISKQKGEFVTLEEFRSKAEGYLGKILCDIWEKYEKELRQQRTLDFDDLLVKPVQFLKANPIALANYQERFKFIHIDEYQDTNQSQYELSRILASKYKNICVVGDADQTIYSWRGANLKNILRFEDDYPEAKVVLLEQNYRSTQMILTAANEVIKKNTVRKEKNLFTENAEGAKITLLQTWDENREATTIARRIRDLIVGGADAKDIAILYRANFQSRVLEQALIASNISYQVLGVRFFERKEIKDVLSYLRLAVNPENQADLKRAVATPPRGIGKTTLLKILAGQQDDLPQATKVKVDAFFVLIEKIKIEAQTKKLSETLTFIIQKSGLEALLMAGTQDDLERLENIRELVSLATLYDILPPEDALVKFLEEATLVSDQDTTKEELNAVRLMTVHASKGLEFKYVFVTGLEQDLFPHKKMGNGPVSKEDSEEERRLFYVALTRAREKLFLSYAELRTLFGSKQINAPSEFLRDIPDHVVEVEMGETESDIGTVVYL